ncbi:MAG: phenylacetate-CoA oxygenase subunit PaaJ [Bacteroidetes bacterium]|nr:MAG: phenylacetate-CoA oxygenase subunit PaaJ [Bacteroidota bacterium]
MPFTPDTVREILQEVKDPEIPVLSVVKMGIIHDVRVEGDRIEVDMVPTFAGCPAIEVMKRDIERSLYAAGAREVQVFVRYKQAWSTNQITEEGRRILKDFGLSPPPRIEGTVEVENLMRAECPICGSTDTRLLNSFGPTACRAIHHCNTCHETFEQMKPL